MLILKGLLESFFKDLSGVEICKTGEVFTVRRKGLKIDLDINRDVNIQFEMYIWHNKDKILRELEEGDDQLRSWLKDVKNSETISEVLINLGKALPESFSELLGGVRIKTTNSGDNEVLFNIPLDNSKYIFSFTCNYNRIVLDGIEYIKEVLKNSLNEIKIEDLKSTKFLDWMEGQEIIRRVININ